MLTPLCLIHLPPSRVVHGSRVFDGAFVRRVMIDDVYGVPTILLKTEGEGYGVV